MSQTMQRISISVNGDVHPLAQGSDVEELKHDVTEAIDAGGRFVEMTVVGNRRVSALVTASTSVTISVETVDFDARDDGDAATPYDDGGEYGI